MNEKNKFKSRKNWFEWMRRINSYNDEIGNKIRMLEYISIFQANSDELHLILITLISSTILSWADHIFHISKLLTRNYWAINFLYSGYWLIIMTFWKYIQNIGSNEYIFLQDNWLSLLVWRIFHCSRLWFSNSNWISDIDITNWLYDQLSIWIETLFPWKYQPFWRGDKVDNKNHLWLRELKEDIMIIFNQ